MPGCTKDVVHSIKLNTQRPINVRSYPIPFSQISTAEEEVAKMLQMGVIEHSNSAYNSPLLFVKKSDGSLRPVIDFRQLNKATQFDAEPIPNPENIFVKLESKKYFSKLDFCKENLRRSSAIADERRRQGKDRVLYFSRAFPIQKNAVWSG